jgi:hypothetical protein
MGNTRRGDSCLLYFLDGIYVDSVLFGVYSLRNEENTTSDFCRYCENTTARHVKELLYIRRGSYKGRLVYPYSLPSYLNRNKFCFTPEYL